MTDYRNRYCILEKFDKCQKEIEDGCEVCPNFIFIHGGQEEDD